MVKKTSLLVLIIVGLVTLSFVSPVFAQREYYFGQEWTKIWINQDGSIDLLYNVSLTLESGKQIRWVEIGQPKGDFTIGSAKDQYGDILLTSDNSSGSDYKVGVSFHTPLQARQTIWFTLLTNVAKMIYEDDTNPGNDGMQFTLSWFSEAIIEDARILIVLPPGVTENQVKTGSIFWNNVQYEGDRLAVYWEKQNLNPNEKFSVGVSYPKQEGWTSYAKKSDLLGDIFSEIWPLIILAIIIVIIIFLVYRKRPYITPKIGIECLGILRGLTAVEASYLLELKPPQIVTEILYSVLKKRAVWVENTNPSLQFKVLKPFLNKIGTKEKPLRYYEIDFLNAIKPDGSLDEKKLASTIMEIQSTVEKKLKGYCRKDTIDYYRRIVEKAWKQVETAETAKLTSKLYDEQLLWLLLDPNTSKRTQTVFNNRVFEPEPFWFWYWYSYRYYSPNPTYNPNIKTPSKSPKTPAIPGADFANNIANAIEQSANNFVVNLEKFSNSILPQPPKSSKQPIQKKAKCVCACAACACACACVSCACACAGGGVG
jgi:hypothetical protein